MSDQIVHVSDATFDAEVLNSDIPVLVKVDVDANPDIPPKFGIRGIPTLIVFKDGNAEATKVGALSKTQLTEFIQEIV
jgi:thioredoxin 1